MSTKQFKITWAENNDGCHSIESMVIDAKNEDDACNIWERDIEPNINTSGIDDCTEIFETPLFEKSLLIDMPNGVTYAVPVEVIARNRARYYANKEYDGDIIESLRDDTVPLFLSSDFEVVDWAQNNMDWKDVKDQAVQLVKKVAEDKSQEVWLNGDHKISQTP